MIQKEIKQNKIIYLSFDEARKIVREKGFKNRREHEKWAKSEKRPKNIPSRPDHIYKEWIDWPDYLGNNNKANQDKNKEYWSFEKAREFAHGLGFKNREQYYEWHRSQNPSYMPSRPESTYKNKGWKGWTDFLDTGNKFGQLEPLPFEEAKRIIQERHFTSQDAYNIWSASGKRPKNIPSHPYTVYKEDWKGWVDFLGYEVVEPLPYEEAKEFMHNLKPRIKSNEEFYKWSVSGKRPKNIPEAPSKVYKNKDG